jgi:hypothetical protein
LRNLPEDLLTFLDVADRNAVMVKSDACADELGRADLAAPSLRAALFARAGVPDDYREWQQASPEISAHPTFLPADRDDSPAASRGTRLCRPAASRRLDPTGLESGNWARTISNDLRALPRIDGTTRSTFGPDGIIPGTERGERVRFWPSGSTTPAQCGDG